MSEFQIIFPAEDVFIPSKRAIIGQGLELETKAIPFELTNAYPDAEQIVSELADLAQQYGTNPYLRDFVISLFPSNMKQDDRKTQITAIVNFMKDKVIYVRDPNAIEYVQSPMNMLKQVCTLGKATGDCDDHVLFFNAMVNTVGFSTRVNTIKTGGSEYYNHVFSSVKNGSKWVDMDLCVKSNPYQDYSKYERFYADS